MVASTRVVRSLAGGEQRLREMIENPNTSERVRLDAIKHWQKIQGIGVDTAPLSVSQTNFINHTNIVTIAKGRKWKRPRFNTVDGELVDE